MSDPDKRKPLSNSEKWWFSVVIALIYIIFACGPAFAVTNIMLKPICFQTYYGNGGPTIGGLILHAALVLLIVRLAIENTDLFVYDSEN